jgi:hypothetical protein
VNLRYRVEKLERMMGLVEKILDTQRRPLIPEGETANALVSIAQVLVEGTREINLGDVQMWAPLLGQMDEHTFESCRQTNGDLFYRLCLALEKWLVKRPNFDHSLDLQVLQARLDRARTRLRSLILLDLARSGQLPEEEITRLYGSDSDPKEQVFAQLRRTS